MHDRLDWSLAGLLPGNQALETTASGLVESLGPVQDTHRIAQKNTRQPQPDTSMCSCHNYESSPVSIRVRKSDHPRSFPSPLRVIRLIPRIGDIDR